VIGILIADDHPIVREGLKRILEECPDMRVVAEAVDSSEVVEKSRQPGVDVLLLDVSMPGPGFLETLQRIRAREPSPRVLVLSVHPEDQFAVRALRAGAAGYLTKDQSPEELAEAIRRVQHGGRYVSRALAEPSELEPDTQRPPHESPSDREDQVFERLAAGQSVKEIASELALSPKTVSTYRTRILQKMKLGSNAELIRYAVRAGLVD
jgi:DNA-binding NarL/FixJ family response regulator